MIEVRLAVPADGDALGRIHSASWAVAYAPFFDPEFAERGVEDRLGRWHDRITDEHGTLLVASVDGRPLALSYSVPSPTRPGFAEIFSFYSHPDGWGTGVAAELITHTLRHLHERGFDQVHLWTLRDTPQSRRFYSKSGFVETGAVTAHDFGDGNPLDQVEYQRSCT